MRKGKASPARHSEHLDLGIKRDKSRSPVARVECNAMVAHAEHSVSAVDTIERCAS